jgi:hypothetical protein
MIWPIGIPLVWKFGKTFFPKWKDYIFGYKFGSLVFGLMFKKVAHWDILYENIEWNTSNEPSGIFVLSHIMLEFMIIGKDIATSRDATECYPNGYTISVNRAMLAISIKSPEWFWQEVLQPIVWMHWMRTFLTS